MIAADQAYAPLVQKGDKHRGKQAAIAEVNRTHMAFDNWLMGVEVLAKCDDGVEEQDQRRGREKEKDSFAEVEREKLQSENVPRAHSHSPTSERREFKNDENDSNQDQDGNKASQDSNPSHKITFPHRPSPKRTHSAPSVFKRKRLKFSDSVEFRDDYRNYLELSRSHESYVPGRYAPPDEGYLDTSGAEQSALKFSGVKRVKGGWVEVVPHERKKRGSNKIKQRGRERGRSRGSDDEEDDGGEEGGLKVVPSVSDSRDERVGRRSRRTSSGADVTQGSIGTMAKNEEGVAQSEAAGSDSATDDASLSTEKAHEPTIQQSDTKEAVPKPEPAALQNQSLPNDSTSPKEHDGDNIMTKPAHNIPENQDFDIEKAEQSVTSKLPPVVPEPYPPTANISGSIPEQSKLDSATITTATIPKERKEEKGEQPIIPAAP